MATLLTAPALASFSVALPDELATFRLAGDIASSLQPGDFVTLSGDLGAGKTTLARALIRHLAGDSALEVPSPTFTLMQPYDLPHFPVVHADLYRLSSATELEELGFDDLPEGAVVSLEWPDRAAAFLPPDRFDVALTLAPKLKLEFRHARITGYGSVGPRVNRMATVRQFIAESGYREAPRARLPAMLPRARAKRLALGRQARDPYVVAAAVRRPAVRDGKPLQRDRSSRRECRAVRGNGEWYCASLAYRRRRFTTPIWHQGLLIIEDLGDEHLPGVAIRRHRSRSAMRPRSMRC